MRGGAPGHAAVDELGLVQAMHVVRNVNLKIAADEIVALLGPNGAGKTTTLLTLAGALAPQAGRSSCSASPRKPNCSCVRIGNDSSPSNEQYSHR